MAESTLPPVPPLNKPVPFEKLHFHMEAPRGTLNDDHHEYAVHVSRYIKHVAMVSNTDSMDWVRGATAGSYNSRLAHVVADKLLGAMEPGVLRTIPHLQDATNPHEVLAAMATYKQQRYTTGAPRVAQLKRALFEFNLTGNDTHDQSEYRALITKLEEVDGPSREEAAKQAQAIHFARLNQDHYLTDASFQHHVAELEAGRTPTFLQFPDQIYGWISQNVKKFSTRQAMALAAMSDFDAHQSQIRALTKQVEELSLAASEKVQKPGKEKGHGRSGSRKRQNKNPPKFCRNCGKPLVPNTCPCWEKLQKQGMVPNHCGECHQSGKGGSKSEASEKVSNVSCTTNSPESRLLGLDSHSTVHIIHPHAIPHVATSVVNAPSTITGISGTAPITTTYAARLRHPLQGTAVVMDTLPVFGVLSEPTLHAQGYQLSYMENGSTVVAIHPNHPSLMFRRGRRNILHLITPLTHPATPNAVNAKPPLPSSGGDSRLSMCAVNDFCEPEIASSHHHHVTMSAVHSPPYDRVVGKRPLASFPFMTPNLQRAYWIHASLTGHGVSFDHLRRQQMTGLWPQLSPLSSTDVANLKTVCECTVSNVTHKPIAQQAPYRPPAPLGSEFAGDSQVFMGLRTQVFSERNTGRISAFVLPDKSTASMVKAVHNLREEYKEFGHEVKTLSLDPERVNQSIVAELKKDGISTSLRNAMSHEPNAEAAIKRLEHRMVPMLREARSRLGVELPSRFASIYLATAVGQANNTPTARSRQYAKAHDIPTENATPEALITNHPPPSNRLTFLPGDIVTTARGGILPRSRLEDRGFIALVLGLDIPHSRVVLLNVESYQVISRAPEALTHVDPMSLSRQSLHAIHSTIQLMGPNSAREREVLTPAPAASASPIATNTSSPHPAPAEKQGVQVVAPSMVRTPRFPRAANLNQRVWTTNEIALPAITRKVAREHPTYNKGMLQEATNFATRKALSPTLLHQANELERSQPLLRMHDVFALKNGAIKARFVVNGSPSTPHEEDYAAVAKRSTLLSILAHAQVPRKDGAYKDIFHMDMAHAYLHADLPPHVTPSLVIVPQRIAQLLAETTKNNEWTKHARPNNGGTLARQQKCIYGNRYAGAGFAQLVDSTLRKAGLVPSLGDSCLYHVRLPNTDTHAPSDGDMMTHSDDFVITEFSDSHAVSAAIKPSLASRFKNEYRLIRLTPAQPLRVLGVDIKREQDGALFLSQKPLIHTMLVERDTTRRGASTPSLATYMDPPSRGPQLSPPRAARFVRLVAKTGYLVITRPDVMAAHQFLSVHTHDPCEMDEQMVDKLLDYLHVTQDHGIYLRRTSNHHPRIIVQADAALGTRANKFSQTGVFTQLEDVGLLSAISKRQLRVASSSQEAESNAQYLGIQNGLFHQQLAAGFQGLRNLSKVVVAQDNESAASRTTSIIPKSRAAKQYNDLTSADNRDKFRMGEITIVRLKSADMNADALTKHTPSSIHRACFQAMMDPALLPKSTIDAYGSPEPRGCVADSPILPCINNKDSGLSSCHGRS